MKVKNNDDARKLFEKIRWGDKPVCHKCVKELTPNKGYISADNNPDRKQPYFCNSCRGYVSVRSGTFFDKSKHPYLTLFKAVQILHRKNYETDDDMVVKLIAHLDISEWAAKRLVEMTNSAWTGRITKETTLEEKIKFLLKKSV